MIGFFYRESNARSVSVSKKLKMLLEREGFDFCELDEDSCTLENRPELELIIVFGGDGSVLRASKIALDKTPIVAINTGNLGFLTSYEENELEALVQKIKENKLRFSTRKMMTVEANGNIYYALNDAVIVKDLRKDHASECVKLHLEIDGNFVDSYVADGLIISTPTGSTAYALSAGGPILTPNLDVMVAAPICSHSLNSRPIVFSSAAQPKVTVDKTFKPCVLYVDGKLVEALNPNATVTARFGEKSIRICDRYDNFFAKLNKKLSMWSAGESLTEVKK